MSGALLAIIVVIAAAIVGRHSMLASIILRIAGGFVVSFLLTCALIIALAAMLYKPQMPAPERRTIEPPQVDNAPSRVPAIRRVPLQRCSLLEIHW